MRSGTEVEALLQRNADINSALANIAGGMWCSHQPSAGFLRGKIHVETLNSHLGHLGPGMVKRQGVDNYDVLQAAVFKDRRWTLGKR